MKRNQFLIWPEQLSVQKIKLWISRFLRMKCIKALATSSANRPVIASCHNAPVGFKVLDFFLPPTCANVSLKRTNLLQNIACFRSRSLGSIIIFCISTDIPTSCSAHSRFFLKIKRSSFCGCCYMVSKINTHHNHQQFSYVSLRQRRFHKTPL